MSTPDAQEQYWQICERYNAAILAIAAAADEPLTIPDDDPRGLELTAARDALEAFCRDHAGETFRLLRPEWIRTCIDPELEPWDL